MTKKHFSKSRTLRFNAVVMTLASALLTAVVQNDELIKATVSPAVYLGVVIGIALVNAWLRMNTDQGVSLK